MKETIHYLISTLVFSFLFQACALQEASSDSTSATNQEKNLKAEQISEPATGKAAGANISQFQMLIFILALFIAISFLSILYYFVCKKRKIARCTKKICRRNKMIPMLRQKYDVIGQNSISQIQFKKESNKIFKMFEKTKQNKVFSFKSQNQQQNIFSKISIRSKKEENYHETIELEGEDKFGEWTGQGSILCYKDQILIWFTQQYYDISKIWNQQTRLFTSTNITQQIVTGKWQIKRESKNIHRAGVWVLQSVTNQSSVSVQRIESITENE